MGVSEHKIQITERRMYSCANIGIVEANYVTRKFLISLILNPQNITWQYAELSDVLQHVDAYGKRRKVPCGSPLGHKM